MKKMLFALLTVAGIATAQADSLNGSFGVGTDYRFRGISQTQNGPSTQGTIDYAHDSGLYVEGKARSVSAQEYTNGSGVEFDAVAGFKKDVYEGLIVDVGSYNYFYPNATNGTNKNFNTNELYAGLGYGPFSTKYSRSMGNYFGIANSNGTQYFQADVKYPVPGFERINLLAHAGHTYVTNTDNLNYSDFNLGASYNFYKNWSLAAKWYKNSDLTQTLKTSYTVNGEKLYKQSVGAVLSTTF